MGDIVDYIELMLHWRRSRDAHKRLCDAIDKTGENYESGCKPWQKFIKARMLEKQLEVVPAVCDMLDDLGKSNTEVPIAFLAAAYELASKNDFTI